MAFLVRAFAVTHCWVRFLCVFLSWLFVSSTVAVRFLMELFVSLITFLFIFRECYIHLFLYFLLYCPFRVYLSTYYVILFSSWTSYYNLQVLLSVPFMKACSYSAILTTKNFSFLKSDIIIWYYNLQVFLSVPFMKACSYSAIVITKNVSEITEVTGSCGWVRLIAYIQNVVGKWSSTSNNFHHAQQILSV